MSYYLYFFSLLIINGMMLKNCIIMFFMGINMVMFNGEVLQEQLEYYELWVKGGIGFIIIENICIDFFFVFNGII